MVQGSTRGRSETCFSFLHNVQPTQGLTGPPVQWVGEIKRPERDVDLSPGLSMYAFMARNGTVLPFVRNFFRSGLWRYGFALNKYSDPRTFENGYIFYHIIIIIIIIIEFLTSQLWLGKYSPILGCSNQQD